MALRSLLRKMPSLALRSSPPTMGPGRALSPAAGSRLMSHGAPGAEIITQEELARERAEIDRINASFYKGMEEIRETRRAFFSADIAKNERTKKEFQMMMMASNAVIILSVPATLYMMNFW